MSLPITLAPSNSAVALADFAANLSFSSLPEDVIHHALLIVRDTLGTILAGAALPEVRGLAQMVSTLGGNGKSTVIGHGICANPHTAALVNGTAGVSLELDEGNQYAINHPSVHILPAVMALAEDQAVSGPEFLTAFVAGYEVAVRVGRVTRLRQPVHPFGTHAITGTAAGASRILALTVEETARALELAANLTIASSQTAANSGASVRNLFTGLTNHNGLLAPLLIKAGFNGEPDALQRIYGGVLGDGFSDDSLGHDLGEEFYIARNYFKMHACSRWNHAPIEATASLLEASPFTAEDVETITVWTYDPATRLSGGTVTNGYAAKHSIPYNVAARIVHKSNDLEVYSDQMVNDAALQALLANITVREDPELTAMLPDVRPARVEVKLRSGETLVQQVDRPRGGFDNPVSEDELMDKFRKLASITLDNERVDSLAALIWKIPTPDDLGALSALLVGGSS